MECTRQDRFLNVYKEDAFVITMALRTMTTIIIVILVH